MILKVERLSFKTVKTANLIVLVVMKISLNHPYLIIIYVLALLKVQIKLLRKYVMKKISIKFGTLIFGILPLLHQLKVLSYISIMPIKINVFVPMVHPSPPEIASVAMKPFGKFQILMKVITVLKFILKNV